MKVDILGLGESLKEYSPSDNITIGVNDIFKFHPVDYLVCVDNPQRFSAERFNTIINSNHKKFYTHYKKYKNPIFFYNKKLYMVSL